MTSQLTLDQGILENTPRGKRLLTACMPSGLSKLACTHRIGRLRKFCGWSKAAKELKQKRSSLLYCWYFYTNLINLHLHLFKMPRWDALCNQALHKLISLLSLSLSVIDHNTCLYTGLCMNPNNKNNTRFIEWSVREQATKVYLHLYKSHSIRILYEKLWHEKVNGRQIIREILEMRNSRGKCSSLSHTGVSGSLRPQWKE